MEEIKNKQTEMNNTITAIKNTLGGTNSRITEVEEWISELEDRMVEISAERSAVNHMGFPLYVTCCFSLAVFNILSLCLVSVSLINTCLNMFLLGFNL